MFDSLRPYPTRLLCPRDSPGKDTGVGCHFLLQGIFLPRDQTHLSVSPALAGGSFTTNATWEALQNLQLRFQKYLFSHDIIQFKKFLFINLLFFGYAGSSLLCVGYSLVQCTYFLLQWLLLLRSMGSSVQASIVVAHGLQSLGSVVVAQRLSCSTPCGNLLDQGLNLCSLHWQLDSKPLDHQGSPCHLNFNINQWEKQENIQ